jgi:hypothetical protein
MVKLPRPAHVVAPRRSAALREAQLRHDEARADRRIVLRLNDEELLALIALAEPGETPQATLRRLLATAARKRPKR